MDVWSSLMDGFATALTPMNLLYAVIGVLLGTAVGVLPGLGPAMQGLFAARQTSMRAPNRRMTR